MRRDSNASGLKVKTDDKTEKRRTSVGSKGPRSVQDNDSVSNFDGVAKTQFMAHKRM